MQGEFLDNKPHGKGVLKKKTGISIEGNFVEGELDKSACKVTYEDGRVYEGSIDEKFKPHGKGVLSHSSENVVSGTWVHGIQDV